jgi:hypothetical protein
MPVRLSKDDDFETWLGCAQEAFKLAQSRYLGRPDYSIHLSSGFSRIFFSTASFPLLPFPDVGMGPTCFLGVDLLGLGL